MVGKFIAAWLFIAISLILTFPLWITVNWLGQPDNGVILASYIGKRITKRDLSLNTAVSNSEDEGLEFIDLLEDESKSPELLVSEAQENDIRNKYLLEAIEELTERERHIFEERRLSENPLTLEKLGEYYGIS